jgi:hypothetical protein
VQIAIAALIGINHAPSNDGTQRRAFDNLRLRRGAHSVATSFDRTLAMKTEKLHEGWRALWLGIAGVMVIMLIWNVVMLSLNGISY